MEKREKSIKSDILLRVRILYIVFVALGLGVMARIVWVQFDPATAKLTDRLAARIFTTDSLPAHRGSIYDRNGEPLAVSIFQYEPLFDFGNEALDSVELFNYHADSLAKLLSAFFKDRSPEEYRNRLIREHTRRYRLDNPRDSLFFASKGYIGRQIDSLLLRFGIDRRVKRTVYTARRQHTPIGIFPRTVDYAEWQELRRYPLLNRNMGFVYKLDEQDRRVYPYGGLLRRTLGRLDVDKPYGIEQAYRDTLAGTPGKAHRQRIARGYSGRVIGSENEDPVNGADITTTIDIGLQEYADRVLRERLTSQNATWGTTIVMEVATGDILAMVNLGRDETGGFSEIDNYALTYCMEPGSTLKLCSMLALIEDAEMPLSTRYDTNNGRKTDIGPARGENGIQDSHGGFREMDFVTAAAQSSNVWFARAIWDTYGITGRKQEYMDYLCDRLHIHETVGLERLGEVRPRVQRDWKVPDPGMMLVKMAYGYRVRMTPVQMLTLYNAVANGGRKVAPRLIREIRRGNSVIERPPVRVIEEKICSQRTLEQVRICLEEVCRSGTGKAYFRDTTRYRAAGKTGTAQIFDNRYNLTDRRYLASMVAYFPADAPRYTVLTSIETRRQGGLAFYGGPLSGPVVGAVADYLYNRETTAPLTAAAGRCYPQQIKDGDVAQMRRVAKEFSAKVESDARKGWGHGRVDSLARVEIKAFDAADGRVPDVRGMGLKEALFLLENRGLRVQSTGSGAVVSQSIAPGTAVTRGATVTITLK